MTYDSVDDTGFLGNCKYKAKRGPNFFQCKQPFRVNKK